MDNSGERIKIGVIDVGFNGYSDLAAKGEVPPTFGDNAVNSRCYNSLGIVQTGARTCQSRILGINHGTAVAEAAIDIAPGASLYISNPSVPYIGENYKPRQFRETVEWMLEEGVDVIVHSRGWPFDGPGDGTSQESDSPLQVVSTAISGVIRADDGSLKEDDDGNAINNPVVWVNSAGNQARGTWFARYRGISRPSSHPVAREYTLSSSGLVRFNGAAGTDYCNRVSYTRNSSVGLKGGTKFYYHLR